ncbi:hypothetical protein J6590_025652 [Homalodisca vitripennis]|nr:hypothetical protein J6590_025652 [Homalodisca vitripennis]
MNCHPALRPPVLLHPCINDSPSLLQEQIGAAEACWAHNPEYCSDNGSVKASVDYQGEKTTKKAVAVPRLPSINYQITK